MDTGEVVCTRLLHPSLAFTWAFTSIFGTHLMSNLVQGTPGKICSICWLPDVSSPALHVSTSLANRHHITCQKQTPQRSLNPKHPPSCPGLYSLGYTHTSSPLPTARCPVATDSFSPFKIIQHSSTSVLQLSRAVLLTA